MKNSKNTYDLGKIFRKAKRGAFFCMFVGAVIAIVSLCAGSIFLVSSDNIPTTGPRSTAAIARRQHESEELAPSQENVRLLAAAEAARETRDAEDIQSIMECVAYSVFIMAAVGGYLFYMSLWYERMIEMIRKETGAKAPQASITLEKEELGL